MATGTTRDGRAWRLHRHPTNQDLGAMLQLVQTNGRTSGTGMRWPTGHPVGRLAISAVDVGTSRGIMLFCADDFPHAITVETDTGTTEELQLVVDPDEASIAWAPYVPLGDTRPVRLHVESKGGLRAHQLPSISRH